MCTAGKQKKVTDYVVNLRAILSSFYVGTGGLDIGLMHSAQGIAEDLAEDLAHTVIC